MAVQSKKSMKEQLQRRMGQEQSHYRKVGSLFLPNLVGVKFYKETTGANLLDILTYCSGKNDPVLPGDPFAHKLVIFIHRAASVTGEDMICMEQTFKGKKRRCPNCIEYRSRIERGCPESETKPYKYAGWPRVIYNIYDRMKPGDGAQIWNASAYLFQQYLDVICRKSPLPGQKQGQENFVAYMDPSLDGRSIGFDRQGKDELKKYIGVHFEERSTPVPDEIVAAAKVLDELIAWPTFESSYEDLWGVKYEGIDGAPKVTTTSYPAVSEDRQTKYEADTEGSASEPASEEEKPAPEEEESEEDRETRELEEKLAKKKAEKAAKEAIAAKEKEADGKKKKDSAPKATGGNPCPAGHKFGVDIDEKPECSAPCNQWKACALESDRLENAK